jgi:hypothetical protein
VLNKKALFIANIFFSFCIFSICAGPHRPAHRTVSSKMAAHLGTERDCGGLELGQTRLLHSQSGALPLNHLSSSKQKYRVLNIYVQVQRYNVGKGFHSDQTVQSLQLINTIVAQKQISLKNLTLKGVMSSSKVCITKPVLWEV